MTLFSKCTRLVRLQLGVTDMAGVYDDVWQQIADIRTTLRELSLQNSRDGEDHDGPRFNDFVGAWTSLIKSCEIDTLWLDSRFSSNSGAIAASFRPGQLRGKYPMYSCTPIYSHTFAHEHIHAHTHTRARREAYTHTHTHPHTFSQVRYTQKTRTHTHATHSQTH